MNRNEQKFFVADAWSRRTLGFITPVLRTIRYAYFYHTFGKFNKFSNITDRNAIQIRAAWKIKIEPQFRKSKQNGKLSIFSSKHVGVAQNNGTL